jgi:DNA-binding transcriptional MerR regulator
VRVSSFELAPQQSNRADQVKGGVHMVVAKPMTIGQLARRTGVPIKTLREYEQLGLIYTLGRSESNYRLFGEEALWCVQVIRTMRSLGLTLKEIQDLAALYLERPDEPIGPHFGEKLEAALTRIEARITELQALRQRIRDFQSAHAAELAGETELDLLASDPRHTVAKFPS